MISLRKPEGSRDASPAEVSGLSPLVAMLRVKALVVGLL
jgi:hypothetical protein